MTNLDKSLDVTTDETRSPCNSHLDTGNKERGQSLSLGNSLDWSEVAVV